MGRGWAKASAAKNITGSDLCLLHTKCIEPTFENFGIFLAINEGPFSKFYTHYTSVPTDLAEWGPSGPDRTTKIFRTGPNGPGPDLSEKKVIKWCKKTCQNLTMLNAHVWFVFESLLLSFYNVWIILQN